MRPRLISRLLKHLLPRKLSLCDFLNHRFAGDIEFDPSFTALLEQIFTYEYAINLDRNSLLLIYKMYEAGIPPNKLIPEVLYSIIDPHMYALIRAIVRDDINLQRSH